MIEHQTIDGRGATVAYLTADWKPADKDAYALAKIEFDNGDIVFVNAPDEGSHEAHGFNKHRRHARPAPHADIEGDDQAGGWARHRTNHQVSLLLVLEAPEEILPDTGTVNVADISVKMQLVAWAKAIMVLDASEILIRDLIERDLAGHTGKPVNVMKGLEAIPAANRLVAKIKPIREDAIRTAFRLLRVRLGDVRVLDKSLAVWAKAFAAHDLETIRTAIMIGLHDGIDNTEIARKVVGTMGLNGVDGVTEFTRHKIAHLGRAAIKEANLRKAGISP